MTDAFLFGGYPALSCFRAFWTTAFPWLPLAPNPKNAGYVSRKKCSNHDSYGCDHVSFHRQLSPRQVKSDPDTKKKSKTAGRGRADQCAILVGYSETVQV